MFGNIIKIALSRDAAARYRPITYSKIGLAALIIFMRLHVGVSVCVCVCRYLFAGGLSLFNIVFVLFGFARLTALSLERSVQPAIYVDL